MSERSARASSPLAVTAGARQRWRAWIAVVLGLLVVLALLAWWGTGGRPLPALAWTSNKAGWIYPVPSFLLLWLAAALAFWLLSAIAWLLFTTPPNAPKLKPLASAILIFVVAAVLRIIIARTWGPVDVAFAGFPYGPAPLFWLISADLTAVAALLLVLFLRQKSLWWAVLYAWHPLVLIEIAANGSQLATFPFMLLLLVTTAARWRWMIVPLALGLFTAGAWGLSAAGVTPFNSLLWEFARNFLFRGNEAATRPAILLLLVVGELAVLMLSLRRRWDLPTTLGHMIIIYLLCTPAMIPAQMLLPLVLLPLAWNRAAWVLSLTSLAAYAAVLVKRNGDPFALPDWLLMLAWMPVWIVEIHALTDEMWRAIRDRRSESSPKEPPLSPAAPTL